MKRVTAIIALLALMIGMCACGTGNSHETEATQMKNIYQKSDPGQDDTLNILMIGSSFCFYYVEELYGLLEAAGIKANVCNVYYSGCPLEKHWSWWKTGESNYDFYITNGNYSGSWDYGAMIEYMVGAMILCIVVSSVFRLIREAFC
jgi:hypothetical protein